MGKYLEHIVIALTALIFTVYHAVITSLVFSRSTYLDYGFGYIFWVECIAFIPLGIGMVFVISLGKRCPKLFTSLTYDVILKHLFFVSFLAVVHALWQSYMNSVFFGDVFTKMMFTNDFLAFIEMRFLAYLIMIGLVSGLIKIREEQRILSKESLLSLELQKAKLKELEYKMNPEIIYPNLGFIKEHAKHKPDEASQMVILMAGILRKLVDNIEDERIQLSEEVTFFRMYLDLIKLRMKRPFQVVINIDKEVHTEKVPPMILLIPFMEELFFGKYKGYLVEMREIEFEVKILEEEIEERILFKNIKESSDLFSLLENDSKLKNINSLLGNLIKGKVTFNAKHKIGEIHLKLVSEKLNNELSV